MLSPLPPFTEWHTPKETVLYMNQWGEEFIVFNPRSGATHQLNKLAVDALQVMQQPITISLLTRHLCSLYQVDDKKDLFIQLERLINLFDNLGLIEPFNQKI